MLGKSKNYPLRMRFISLFILLIIGFSFFIFKNPSFISKLVNNSSVARVLYVIDGDTMDVVIDGKKERVRLIGIDAPEMEYEEKRADCFANQATEALKTIINGNTVSLVSDPTQSDRDSYSRLLRYIFLTDGTNVNKLMISKGYAYEYTYKGIPYQYQKDFQEAELGAKENKIGIWAEGICPVMIQ
jgi:micrococcal nuclease